MPVVILIIALLPLILGFYYDVGGVILYHNYPFVDYEKIRGLEVGMEKAEVDKLIGNGREIFVEDEDGRQYSCFYRTRIGRDVALVILNYDNENILYEILVI